MIKTFFCKILFFLLSISLMAQHFAIVGDFYAAGPNTLAVSQLIKSWNPDFVLTVGDNYSTYSGTIDDQIGQFYQEYIYPYSGAYGAGDTMNRFFPVLGNHDDEGSGSVNYLSYFTLPDSERYYDFVKGNVHFFALNSNITEPHGTSDTSVQALWLKDKLAASVSPFNIVYFHHPPFSSGIHGSNTYMQWPFKQWGATAVFIGHDHYYEHLNIDNLDYFICGNGGQTLYTYYNSIPGSITHFASNYGALEIKANTDSLCIDFRILGDTLIDRNVIYAAQSVTENILKGTEGNLIIYPNPFARNTSIQFEILEGNNITVSLVSLDGSVSEILFSGFLTCGVHEMNWDTRTIDKGMYLLEINTGLKKIVKKVLIQN